MSDVESTAHSPEMAALVELLKPVNVVDFVAEIPPEWMDKIERLRNENTDLAMELNATRGDFEGRYSTLSETLKRAETVRDELQIALSSERNGRREAEYELESFKERVTARLHELAEDQEWCEEFDNQMEKFGLRRRKREWRIGASVTVRFDVETSLTSDKKLEDILNEMSNDQGYVFREAIDSELSFRSNSYSYEIVKVEDFEEVDD